MSSHVWAFVVSLFCLFPLSLVPLHSLSFLPVVCSELQLPPCRERRALIPKRTRQMRSIAPWRYTTLSHFHEVEVCQRREASAAKVTMDQFFDNRVDFFLRVPARECLVNIGIHQITGWRNATSQIEEKVKTKALWLLWKAFRSWGCAVQDSNALDPQGTKEFRWHSMQKVSNAIQRVRFTKSTLRHASIWDKKGPSLGKIHVKPRHQRSPYATKFEDRSHEETEIQERCAQSKAWDLAKNMYKLKEKDKATCFSLAKWVLPCASSRESVEREFEVDCGASMHMVSEKDLNSAKLETMRTSKSPTTVMTANGKVRTNKEATVYVKELDVFVTVMLLQETPAVPSLGKLCDDHGYTYHWKRGQNPHLTHQSRHTFWAINVTRSKCRGKEASEAKVTLVPFFDNRADSIWKVLARDHLVNIGIHPSANSTNQKRVVSQSGNGL